MKIDRNTILDYKNRAILHISCFLIHSGCAGEKVSVLEFQNPDMDDVIDIDGVFVHIRKDERSFFEEAILTKIQGKWIIQS
jgi:hypothetical protein